MNPNLSKEERLKLNNIALMINAKLLLEVDKLIKAFIKADNNFEEHIFNLVIDMINQKNKKDEILLRIRYIILNEID